ncbi:hypothetical protein AVEN_5613-1 [Araneus ventricosus]|uniref:Uncharacterized protein n=1 Tax=Araneus ventricosus TaxID=182803 RepID=A0A4Y2V716_ARAVE|nr:hypothetical protein AVEN_5613-1 [Araneus ventricosus]
MEWRYLWNIGILEIYGMEYLEQWNSEYMDGISGAFRFKYMEMRYLEQWNSSIWNGIHWNSGILRMEWNTLEQWNGIMGGY